MERLDVVLGRLDRGRPGGTDPEPVAANPAVLPDCAHCQNVRWFRRTVPVGHPDFGQPVPCACIAAWVAAREYAALAAASWLAALADCTFGRFEFLAQVQRVPLLILDDLGVEAGTPWVREKLYRKPV